LEISSYFCGLLRKHEFKELFIHFDVDVKPCTYWGIKIRKVHFFTNIYYNYTQYGPIKNSCIKNQHSDLKKVKNQ
jgi:MoaA/NifB/PqqE/SkfB family radical SAM enzyme